MDTNPLNPFTNDRVNANVAFAIAMDDQEEIKFLALVELQLNGIFGTINEQLEIDNDLDPEDRYMHVIAEFPTKIVPYEVHKEVASILRHCYEFNVGVIFEEGEGDFIDTYNELLDLALEGDKCSDKAIGDYLKSLDTVKYIISWDLREDGDEGQR